MAAVPLLTRLRLAAAGSAAPAAADMAPPQRVPRGRPGPRAALAAAAGAALATLLLASAAQAQDSAAAYPSHPVRLITPVPPGGAVDRITRAWTACVEARTGQPVVLDYRPQGNGVVAVMGLRQAAPDGYTLLVAGMSQTTIVPFMTRKPRFDPMQDLQPIGIFGTTPYVLVASAQSDIHTVRDLEERARSTPGGVNIGVPNVGTPAHLLSAALAERLRFPATLVPTGGEASGLTALLAGTVQAMAFLPGTVAPYLAAGKLVPLASFTRERLPDLQSVPTAVELTGDASLARPGWLGIAAPAGTPPKVVDELEEWTQACAQDAAFREALSDAKVTPIFVPRRDMSRWMARDIAFWRPWIAELKLQAAD